MRETLFLTTALVEFALLLVVLLCHWAGDGGTRRNGVVD